MASKDKLWFEMGVREDVSKTLDSLLGKTTRLQQALLGASKDFGFKNAYKNAAELESAFDKIATALGKVRKAKLITTDKSALKELDQVEKKLKKMQRELNGLWRDIRKNPNSVDGGLETAGLVKSFLDKHGLNLATEQVNRLLRTNATSQKNAANAAKENARVNQNLVSAYNKVTEAARGTNKILDQFKNQMSGLVGLYGLERFARSIVTIGGQFEYQHVALQNILRDAEKANTLFTQLQDLAVNSPKTFMELTSYSKQLSAYQIPYDELFDTTKRLADISTGLGVDMGRLILAYGQVRSAAVLRGQELRQFTEAGIPMVQRLADKFTELNGRVVTTGEVFELISKRAVPFKMVQEVLWDMTNEGGQFYDMQGKLADTLYGKWQKLQDTWQIMLGSIADGEGSAGKFFKGILESVVKLTSALDSILPILAFGLGGQLLNKGYLMGMSTFNNITGRTAIKNMEITKMQQANALERERVMLGRELNQSELNLISSKNRLTANELQLLLAEKQITQQQVFQLAQAGKINRFSATRLAYSLGYTKQQIQQIMNGNKQLIQEKQLSLLRRAGSGILGFMGGWSGLGLTAAMAAIGTYMSLRDRAEQQSKEAADLASENAQKISAGLERISSLYSELSSKAPKTNSEIANGIEKITNALKENGKYGKDVDEQVNSVSKLSDKYSILFRHLERISDEYVRMRENVKLYLEEANKIGGGLLYDTMATDLKQWSGAQIALKASMQSVSRYALQIKSQMKEVMQSSGTWNSSMESKPWFEIYDMMTFWEKGELNTGISHLKDKIKIRERLKAYNDARSTLSDKREDVFENIEEYADYIKEALREEFFQKGRDIDAVKYWEDAMVLDLKESINRIVNGYNLDAQSASEFKTRIYTQLFDKNTIARINNIKEAIASDLSPWQTEIQNYLDKNAPELRLTVDEQSTFESLKKALQTKREEFQEEMDTAGRILVKVGFDLSSLPQDMETALANVPVWQREFVKQAFSRYNEGRQGVEKAQQVDDTLGFLSVKKKKNGSKSDSALKAAKTRFDELKSFLSEYKKYREVYSKGKSISILEEMFPTMKGSGEKAVNDFKAVLRELKESLPMTTEERKKFGVGIDRFIADFDLNEAKRKLSDDLKELQEHIQKQTSQWSLYKSLFEKTGDKGFAKSAFTDGRLFDDITKSMDSELRAMTGEGAIDYDMSKAAAEKHYEDNKKAYELWKKIVELTGKNWVDALNAGADAENKLLTTAEKIKNVENEITELKKLRDAATDSYTVRSLNMQIMGKEKEKRGYQNTLFEESPGYIKFFSAVSTMTSQAAEEMGESIKSHLLKAFIKGDITARQYSKSVQDVNNQLEKSRGLARGSASAYFSGGVSGMIDFRQEQVNNATQEVDAAKKALELIEKRKVRNEEVSESEEAEAKKKLAESEQSLINSQKALDALKKFAGKLNSVVLALSIVDNFMKGVVQVAKNLSEMYDALGNESLSKDFEYAADSIGAASSSVSSAMAAIKSAMNGDIGGVIGNVSGIFTAPVTAFAKLHDKRIQETIEESQKRVKSLTTDYQNLQSAMEKALGGAFSKNNSRAMLVNLQRQRDEIQRQIDLEESKKNSDDDRLEELRQSLHEIDESIDDFTENLAEKLYGIDVQGWARQLTDAIVGAWESGEDAAEAYANTVKDIMKDVLVSVLTKKILEAYFDKINIDDYISRALGGHTKEETKVITDDIAAIDSILSEGNKLKFLSRAYVYFAEHEGHEWGDEDTQKYGTLTNYLKQRKSMLEQDISSFGELSEEGLASLAEVISEGTGLTTDAVLSALDKAYAQGLINKGDSSSGLSSNIKGITENTADLLASYLNAIRADVSVDRMTLSQILTAVQTQAEMPVIAQAQLERLSELVRLAQQRTNIVNDIYGLLHSNVNGGNKFSI